MPNLPIASLPELTAVTSNAEFVVEQSGTTYKVKNSTLFPLPTVYGLFSQTGNSVAVSATTVETTIIGGGVGTLFIPENSLQTGISVQGHLSGHINCIGTAEIIVRLKTSSGIILCDSGVLALDAATDKHWDMDLYFTVRNTGVAGVASIISSGVFSYNKDFGATFNNFDFSSINNTTFDTTVSDTLNITVQWNTNNVDNVIYSEIFVLNRIY